MSTGPAEDAFVRRLADRLDALADPTGTAADSTPDDEAVDSGTPVDEAVGAGTPVAEAAVDAVVAQLRSPAMWTEPPASLRDAVLAAAAAEPRPGSPSAAAAPSRRVSRWRRLRWAVPLTAVAAAAFTFAVLAVDERLDRPERGQVYVAAGTPLAPQAGAQVSVAPSPAGFSVRLEPHDLPAAAPGSYYAAWLTGPRGTVPLGSFHARQSGRPVTLWSGVDPAAYPAFTVTLQREGGDPGPSDLTVLTATLDG